MSSRPYRRKVAALALSAILSLPGADFFERLWSFLASPWSESGCRIDPDGDCPPEPLPTDDTDSGCRIDPNGGCRA